MSSVSFVKSILFGLLLLASFIGLSFQKRNSTELPLVITRPSHNEVWVWNDLKENAIKNALFGQRSFYIKVQSLKREFEVPDRVTISLYRKGTFFKHHIKTIHEVDTEDLTNCKNWGTHITEWICFPLRLLKKKKHQKAPFPTKDNKISWDIPMMKMNEGLHFLRIYDGNVLLAQSDPFLVLRETPKPVSKRRDLVQAMALDPSGYKVLLKLNREMKAREKLVIRLLQITEQKQRRNGPLIDGTKKIIIDKKFAGEKKALAITLPAFKFHKGIILEVSRLTFWGETVLYRTEAATESMLKSLGKGFGASFLQVGRELGQVDWKWIGSTIWKGVKGTGSFIGRWALSTATGGVLGRRTKYIYVDKKKSKSSSWSPFSSKKKKQDHDDDDDDDQDDEDQDKRRKRKR